MAGSRSQGAEFVLAGLAACGAITLTNPIDVVKTRLQLQGELAAAGGKAYTGIGQALLRISRKEGLRGLQRGLSAAYLLQFSNVGCRFGAYGSLKQLFGVKPGASATDSLSSMLLGAASGSLAAIVSNPFFLLKSRFQAAGSEDVLHQHSHLSLRKAFCEIGQLQVMAAFAGAAVHIRHQQGLYSQICAGEGWGRHSLRCQPLVWHCCYYGDAAF